MLLALWRRNSFWEQVAFANMSLATVAVLVAALTGFGDNIRNYEGQAPNASLKIVLASTLLIITILTSVSRWKYPALFETLGVRWVYISAYGISFFLALMLGFLGGVILYGF